MITYRNSMPSDAETVAKLLLEVSYIARFLYSNTDDQRNVIEKVSASFQNEEGKNSYKNIHVAETTIDGHNQVIGIVNFYDAIQHTLDKKMKDQFPKDILAILKPLYTSIIPDSLYISALIVEEAFRNFNVGAQLIKYVINKAHELNRKHVCLHVWEDNQRGIHFYQKNNFTFYENFVLSTDSKLLPPSKKIWLTGISVAS